MKPYKEHRPTQFDSHIELENREDWLVLPVSRTRDSGPFSNSNFEMALKLLGGESDEVEVHRFGHWGPGWYEIILVKPDAKAEKEARDIETALANYPVLDDNDYSDRLQEDANETWKNCYNDKSRLEYIRDHRSQFEFHNLSALMGCVRGKFFAGYASELVDDS